MAPKQQNLKGIIVGSLKIVAPTDKMDRTKSRIWEALCTCKAIEYGTRSQLERYAGHIECPGHPLKGKEKELNGFKLVPELRDTPEQAAALAVWESARVRATCHEPETANLPTEGTSNNDGQSETTVPEIIPETPTPEKVKPVKATKPETGSAMLKSRLGLDGYKLETVKLSSPVTISGHKVSKVMFAKAIAGDDRVLLHVEFDPDAAGKRGIVSAMKKLSADEWSSLCAAFAELKLTWREKEPQKKAA